MTMFLAHPDDRTTIYLCAISKDNKVESLPIKDSADRDRALKAGLPFLEIKASTWKDWGGQP